MSLDSVLKSSIRAIPDFPKPGILFRDITPLLANRAAFAACIADFVGRYRDQRVDAVVGVESRGFLFGAPLALELGCAFVPMRKAGKLPAETLSRSYSLEYGEATLEMHQDALAAGQRAVLIDDLLATGGTARAGAELIEEAGAEVVELAFVIELDGLGGRQALENWPTYAQLVYSDAE
jgi:adenine phosphoribosyltransferase